MLRQLCSRDISDMVNRTPSRLKHLESRDRQVSRDTSDTRDGRHSTLRYACLQGRHVLMCIQYTRMDIRQGVRTGNLKGKTPAKKQPWKIEFTSPNVMSKPKSLSNPISNRQHE
jgi:hypothetical protein